MKVTEVIRLGELLAVYGELLAPRARLCMERYYNDDCTLAEIAAEIGISRQAVHDHLQRSARELEEYERVLGLLCERERRVQAARVLLARLTPSECERYGEAIRALAGEEAIWRLKA